jgi:hypothetical protein
MRADTLPGRPQSRTHAARAPSLERRPGVRGGGCGGRLGPEWLVALQRLGRARDRGHRRGRALAQQVLLRPAPDLGRVAAAVARVPLLRAARRRRRRRLRGAAAARSGRRGRRAAPLTLQGMALLATTTTIRARFSSCICILAQRHMHAVLRN